MAALFAACAGVLVLLAIAFVAYHRGLREGRVRLPPDLVAELHEHKTQCLGEPAQRVALEIRLLCETEDPGRA